MKIVIEIIPHKNQRYATCGDYWIEPNGDWQIRVSDLGDWRMNHAVYMHELSELASTIHRGIKEPDIMAFDIAFNKQVADGALNLPEEPGDDPRAPYHQDHCHATGIERLEIAHLGVAWAAYDAAVDNLPWDESRSET